MERKISQLRDGNFARKRGRPSPHQLELGVLSESLPIILRAGLPSDSIAFMGAATGLAASAAGSELPAISSRLYYRHRRDRMLPPRALSRLRRCARSPGQKKGGKM